MSPFRKIGAIALALALVAVTPSGLRAAPPYTRNTGGTTSDGILDALTDIVTADSPISAATALTPSDSTTSTAGRQLAIICTTAGNVKVGFAAGSSLTIPVSVGLTLLPWQVTRVYVTGTTATATYANLD